MIAAVRLPVAVTRTTVEASRGHVGHAYYTVCLDSVPGEHNRTYETRADAMRALDERLARIAAAHPTIAITVAITESDCAIRWPECW